MALCNMVERHCSVGGQPCLSSLRRTTAVGNIGDCDNDMVPLKPGTTVGIPVLVLGILGIGSGQILGCLSVAHFDFHVDSEAEIVHLTDIFVVT